MIFYTQTIEDLKKLLDTKDYSDIINNGFFINILPYPNQNDPKYKVIKTCKHCGSTYKDKEAKEILNNARNLYRQEDTRLYNLFKQGLFIESGLEDNEKSNQAFSIAWQQGHAYGYSEVRYKFLDLIPLLKE